MILDIEALDAKDCVNLMAKENRLRAAVKGVYDMRGPVPFDLYLQRAGMKSAIYDSLPRRAYEFKIFCSKLPRFPQLIESDPIW